MLATLAIGLLLAAAPPPTPTPDVVTLAFGGDVHGELHVRWTLEAGRNPFDGVAPLLSAADLAIVNLETVVAIRGRAQPKRYVYRAHPMLLRAASEAGIDVVNLANNHAWDLGEAGLLSTLDAVAEAGLRAVGGGRDRAEAEAPALIDVRGTTVAIVGVGRVGPMRGARAQPGRPGITSGFDAPRMIAAVEAAADRADVVVVTVHLGRERRSCPQPDDRRFVEALLDAGASVVVGHHPHRIQPIEHADGTLVAYSIGNLVFDARDPEGRRTGVLTVSVQRDGTVLDYAWHPAVIVDGAPTLLDGDASEAELAQLSAVRCD